MTKIKWSLAAVAGGIALAGSVAFAQMDSDRMAHGGMMHMAQGMMQGQMRGQGMQGSGMGPGMHHGSQGAPSGDQSPSSLAFRGVNSKMHEAMDIAYSGNADADFVRGMIPHHQGAIDMAKVVLAFGKDPEVRKLAEAIIKAQDEEISWMKTWLEKNGG